MSQAHMALYALLHGKTPVGEDEFGNKYFKAAPRRVPKGVTARERRWVAYNGDPEASRVPPEWHAWLHYTVDAPPSADNPLRRPWQKPYVPNQTGTMQAYRPPGHVLEGYRRDKATGDYEAWTPPS